MSQQTGRIHLSSLTDDQGGYLDNQTSVLYRYLRERTGIKFTGDSLDRWGLDNKPKVRNTSTRKSEINHQVDPSIEWICHWEEAVNGADPQSETAHWYMHRFTCGCPPSDSALRCTEILEGKGQPVRCAGQPTRYAPGQPRAWSRAQRAPRANTAQSVAAPAPMAASAYSPAADGFLFDPRDPRRP